MKRFGCLLAFAFLISVFTGCGGGGLEEGQPKEVPLSSTNDQFKAEMEKNAAKMKMGNAGRKPMDRAGTGKSEK
jgi:hypothetical protein